MLSYIFTDKAEHDLEKIIDFTVEHGAHYRQFVTHA